MSHVIHIAQDFTRYPAGRYASDNEEHSGETFRDEILIPALNSNDVVIVDFNGLIMCTPSFVEEVFGGIVRKLNINAKALKKKLILRASSPAHVHYTERAWKDIKKASNNLKVGMP